MSEHFPHNSESNPEAIAHHEKAARTLHLLSYDEDVDLAFLTARALEGDHKRGAGAKVIEAQQQFGGAWPVDGDELTKRRMK